MPATTKARADSDATKAALFQRFDDADQSADSPQGTITGEQLVDMLSQVKQGCGSSADPVCAHNGRFHRPADGEPAFACAQVALAKWADELEDQQTPDDCVGMSWAGRNWLQREQPQNSSVPPSSVCLSIDVDRRGVSLGQGTLKHPGTSGALDLIGRTCTRLQSNILLW